MNIEFSLGIPTSGTTLSTSFTTSATLTPVVTTQPGITQAVIYSTAECWVRRGPNPTVATDGTDIRIPPGVLFRTSVSAGDRFSVAGVSSSGVFCVTSGV